MNASKSSPSPDRVVLRSALRFSFSPQETREVYPAEAPDVQEWPRLTRPVAN
jgi:hypothetical protein